MRSPYTENLRGYWLHTTLFWRVFFLIVMGGLGLCIGLMPFEARRRFVLDNIFVVAPVLSALFWGHLGGLVLGARSSILPAPLRPIVCVFVMLCVVPVVVIPAQLAFQMDYNIAGTLACVTILFAAVGWWVTTLWTWLMAVTIAAAIGLLWSLDRGPIAEMIAGQREGLAFALMAAGMIAAAANVAALCRLREESRFFSRRLDMGETGYARPRMTGQVNQLWQSRGTRVHLGLPRNIRIPASGGLFSRAMAWSRLGRGGVGMHFWIAGCGLAGQFLLRHFILDTGKNTQMMIFMWLISMPLMTILAGWMHLWKFLEVESLRPITRRNFIHEIGLAIAINCVQSWGIYAALFMAYTLFGYADAMPLNQCIGWVAASFAINVLAFGPGLWLMRRRAGVWLGLVIGPVSLLGGAGAAMLDLVKWPLSAELAICVAVCGIGVLITRLAGRKWLVMELG